MDKNEGNRKENVRENDLKKRGTRDEVKRVTTLRTNINESTEERGIAQKKI